METLKEFFEPKFLWIITGILLLLLEFIMPGLVIIFFGIGACIVGALCWCMDISLNTQLIIFLVTSILLLISLRKWLKGIFMGHIGSKQDIEQDMDDFIGKKAVVVKAIQKNVSGKVELNGTHWDAEADEDIAEGAPVEITGKNSITLIVKPL